MPRPPTRTPRKRVLTPKVSKEAVKAKADAAAARSSGEEVEAPKVPIDPVIVKMPDPESVKRKEAAIAKRRRRRVTYSAPVAKAVCKMIAMGVPIPKIGARPLMPSETTIYSWARTPNHPFRALFACAREIALRRMGDEMIEIADNSANDLTTKMTKSGDVMTVLNREAIERARLRIQTRQWLMTKLLPEFMESARPGDADKAMSEAAGERPQPTSPDHLQDIAARYSAKVTNTGKVSGDKVH